MFRHRISVGKGQFRISRKTAQLLLNYIIEGAPAPPPHLIKIASIAYYQKLTGYRNFIETGTFKGETLSAAASIFEKCYSIELSKDLYLRARSKFASQRHVEVLNGSSAELFPTILQQITEPAVIWLDAHFSGGITVGEGSDPLGKELETLLKYKHIPHAILIDDARGLGVTQSQLSEFIAGMGKDYHASLLHDSIRVVPKDIPLLGKPIL